MFKVGMYGGSFNPLHLGHVNDIIMAANQCERLFVVLSVTNDKNEIDHKERFMWLKNVTSDMDNVNVIEIFDNNDSKDCYDWDSGAKDVNERIDLRDKNIITIDCDNTKDRDDAVYVEKMNNGNYKLLVVLHM